MSDESNHKLARIIQEAVLRKTDPETHARLMAERNSPKAQLQRLEAAWSRLDAAIDRHWESSRLSGYIPESLVEVSYARLDVLSAIKEVANQPEIR